METAAMVEAALVTVTTELQAVQSRLFSDPTNLLLDAKRDKLEAKQEWLRAKCLAWTKEGATFITVAGDPAVENRWSAFVSCSNAYNVLLQRPSPSSAPAAGPQGKYFFFFVFLFFSRANVLYHAYFKKKKN